MSFFVQTSFVLQMFFVERCTSLFVLMAVRGFGYVVSHGESGGYWRTNKKCCSYENVELVHFSDQKRVIVTCLPEQAGVLTRCYRNNPRHVRSRTPCHSSVDFFCAAKRLPLDDNVSRKLFISVCRDLEKAPMLPRAAHRNKQQSRKDTA